MLILLQEGALCVAANMQEGFQYGQRRQPMAEDCLFLAVYSPRNATRDSKLPILFFIQGGGFTSNSNGNFNGTALVEASGMEMMVVRINYRVGILGFITGTEIENNPTTSSNNGLNDSEFIAPPYLGDGKRVTNKTDSDCGIAMGTAIRHPGKIPHSLTHNKNP